MTETVPMPSELRERAPDKPFTRRFERGDTQRHAEWFIPRLAAFLPQLTPGALQGWLAAIADSSDFMFLYQERAIGLAQLVPDSPRPGFTVQEVFVWAKNPNDETNVAEAAHFYEHFVEWARRKEAATIVVEIATDVPRKVITAESGRRVFETKVAYLRVRE